MGDVEIRANVPAVSHMELNRILDVHWRTKTPLLLLGWAGTGKSQHVREWAKRKAAQMGLRLVDDPRMHVAGETFLFLDFRASQIEPSDIRGLPFPDDGHVQWKIPDFLPEGGAGVIFLDEMNHAQPSVLHALYQLILDRKVGESYTVPEGFMVVAAGNFAAEDAYVSEIPAPLRNRMSIYIMAKPTVEEWTQWAAENGIDTRIIAFIHRMPEALWAFSPDAEEQIAFATPRAWERASMKIQGVEDIDLIRTLVAADVGIELAESFAAFLEEAVNAPTPEEIVRQPERLNEVPPHVSLMYSGTVAEWWRSTKKKEATALLDALLRYRPDAGIVAARIMAATDVKGLTEMAVQISTEAYQRLKSVNEFAKQLEG